MSAALATGDLFFAQAGSLGTAGRAWLIAIFGEEVSATAGLWVAAQPSLPSMSTGLRVVDGRRHRLRLPPPVTFKPLPRAFPAPSLRARRHRSGWT